MEKLKVLVVGLESSDNHYCRRVSELGCEPLFTDADTGSKFPQNADAVIFVGTHLSHGKYEKVKKFYKRLGKMRFEARGGWSSIEQKFVAFVSSYYSSVPAVAVSAPVASNVQAVTIPVPNGTQSEHDHLKHRLSKEERMQVKSIVGDCIKASMTLAETAEMLNADGYRTALGKEFDSRSVFQYAKSLKKASSKEKQSDISQLTTVELIAKVTKSTLPSETKVKTIEKIVSGEIKSEFVIEAHVTKGTSGNPMLSLVKRSVLSDAPEAKVTLTEAQAELVVELSEDIMNFLRAS